MCSKALWNCTWPVFVSGPHLNVHVSIDKQTTRMYGDWGCGLDFNDGQFSEQCDVDGSFFNSDAILIIFGKA